MDRTVKLPSNADLTEADFTGACLAEVDFSSVGSLETCTFDGAKLNAAKFAGRRLAWARFVDADLSRADFTEAKLQAANLTRARLRYASLERADLDHADLTDAILEGVGAMRLNSTIIRGARFMSGCHEPWLELLRAFSGFNLFLHILGLALFAAPLAFQATVLTLKAGLGDVVCATPQANCLPILAVLFGWTDPHFPWVTFTLILGVVYNFARLALTLRVQALARHVAESGRTPPYSPGQQWLTWRWRQFRGALNDLLTALRRACGTVRRSKSHAYRCRGIDPAFIPAPLWSAVQPFEVLRCYVMTPVAWIVYALMLSKAYVWLQLRIPTVLA
jgi:Pentapeptide repeats (9 copies)/Pentapeptide repeats (8 copies)